MCAASTGRTHDRTDLAGASHLRKPLPRESRPHMTQSGQHRHRYGEILGKETSYSETGRKLMILHHEKLTDFEAIVAAMIDHFDAEVLKRLDGSPIGILSAQIKCQGELVDVVFDEACGIDIRLERDNPSLVQLIADFLDGYLPKYRLRDLN
jgi:hypothetical protein